MPWPNPKKRSAVGLLVVLTILVSLYGTGAANGSINLYVSPDGNDSWSGKFSLPNQDRTDGPLVTLEAAKQAVRELKKIGPLPAGGVTVWIQPGQYFLRQGFELTPEDSGTAESPIVYCPATARRFAETSAAPKGQVRICGGQQLREWRKVTNPAILDRLDPVARTEVYQADLKAHNISDFGQMRSRGFARRETPAALELFFQDKPMTIARWPNTGFARIVGFPESTGDDHGGTLGKLTGGFNYEGDRPLRWRDTNDVWVHGYWAYDWANSYEHVESIDTERRLIKTSPPYGNYGFRAGGNGGRFYFLNILEELDQPGEWYLDRKAGIIYFWPPFSPATYGQGLPPAQVRGLIGRAVVSIVESPLIQINNASYVTIRGLVLECSRGDGVRISSGFNNLVADCVIRNLGNNGAVVNGGNNHGVTGCVIYETGDGGISLNGGDRKKLTHCGHYARNNHIHHVARWSRCYAPAISMTGVGILAANNLIHDHPHCAILFWGNEHIIELNEIHHVCLETGDVGAIYTGRDYTYRGNIIRHNFIHHTGGVGMGSMGIYMDDCVSGTVIYGNVLWKLHRAVFLGGGRDFKVENNIFVDCDPAIELDGRGLSKAPVWHDMVYKTMRQRLEDMNWKQPPYSTRYPELADLEQYYRKDDGVPPGNVTVAHNICAGSKFLKTTWGATKDAVVERDNLTDKDLLFVDPGNGDFRLKANSPAFSIGFEPIPFQQIGLNP